MNRTFFIIYFLFGIFWSLYAQVNPNHVYVQGYTRSDGTLVKPYYRTAPNSTNVDNFSTVGNTNPYTGQSGYIPRDDDYAYSYISSNRNRTTSTYRKTEPIKSYGNQNYMVNQKLYKLVKNAQKKDKKFKKSLRSLTKKNRKEIKGKKELDIRNFSDGWYNTTVYSSIEINNEYQEVLFKREVLLENGKVVKYIGSNHLVYDIYDFGKVSDNYKFKLIFPDNTITEQYMVMSFYDKNPLTYVPYYEYPNVVFFYVTDSNNGGQISITLENNNTVYYGGFLKNYWNEIPDCQTTESVVKFYLPNGNYKFFAENRKSFWTNNSLTVNKECQGIRLTFN